MTKLIAILSAFFMMAAAGSAQTVTTAGQNTNNSFTQTNQFVGPLNYYVDTGTANAFVITTSCGPSNPSCATPLTSITAGAVFSFKVANTSTGASTLKVDNASPITISGFGSISSGKILTVQYDGSQFQIVGSGGSGGGGGGGGGTPAQIISVPTGTCTPIPGNDSLQVGLSNGTGAALSINGGACQPITAGLSIYNVMSGPYNAKCDGATDDTAAFNAAYTALSNALAAGHGGGILYVPASSAGTGCVVGTLTIPSGSSNGWIVTQLDNTLLVNQIILSNYNSIIGRSGNFIGLSGSATFHSGANINQRSGQTIPVIDISAAQPVELDHLNIESATANTTEAVHIHDNASSVGSVFITITNTTIEENGTGNVVKVDAHNSSSLPGFGYFFDQDTFDQNSGSADALSFTNAGIVKITNSHIVALGNNITETNAGDGLDDNPWVVDSIDSENLATGKDFFVATASSGMGNISDIRLTNIQISDKAGTSYIFKNASSSDGTVGPVYIEQSPEGFATGPINPASAGTTYSCTGVTCNTVPSGSNVYFVSLVQARNSANDELIVSNGAAKEAAVLNPAFRTAATSFSGKPACAGGTEGEISSITDSTTNVNGATITGSGTNHVLGYCNGTVWTPISGVDAASASTFIASTAPCGGATQCVQWVDDDSTDNCGTATTTWIAAINAYAGVAEPQVIIYGSGKGKAYKFATAGCHLEFDIPTTVHLIGSIDCAQPATTANCIQFGTTKTNGTTGYTNAQIFKYMIDGGGALTGGANLTNAGIEVEPTTVNSLITGLNFINFGATNATLGNCTNYAVLYDYAIAEGTVSFNHWQVTDTGTGRCAFGNPNGNTTGSNTMYYIGNTIGGQNATNTTGCSSQAIIDGGSYGGVRDNNIYAFGVPVRLQGNGHRISGNNIDTAGCTASSVDAAIQYGAASSSTAVGQFDISSNTVQFDNGTSHTKYLFAQAGNSTATLNNVSMTNNVASISNGSFAAPIMPSTVNCGFQRTDTGIACFEKNNPGLVAAIQCGSTNTGWVYENLIAACSSSGQTANLGSTALFTPINALSVLVYCQIELTTAAGTSSTLPQCSVSYTDAFTSHANTVLLTPVWAANTVGCTGSTTNTVGNSCAGQATIVPAAGTAVTYSTSGYASNAAATMQYQAFLRATIN